MQFNYPFVFDKNGRTATADDEEKHIRQLIEQVLFTAQGERINRPTFGSGINQLVFAPNSDDLATTTQLLVQGSLQQWLVDLIIVESVQVENKDSTLYVTIQYTLRKNDQRHSDTFTREL